MSDEPSDAEHDPQTGKQRDTTTGQFVGEHSPDEFEEAIRSLNSDESATTSNIADRVGLTRRGAHNYLTEMEEQGLLKSRKVGPAKVWELPEGDG